jgi:hypothetical protein
MASDRESVGQLGIGRLGERADAQHVDGHACMPLR